MYMRTTVAIFLFLGSYSNADSINRSSNDVNFPASTIATNSRLNIKEELTKIEAICLTTAEYEQISGNIVKDIIAAGVASIVVKESVISIGLAELRSALKFSPLPPWGSYNGTKPSEEELQLAPTPEAYYELKEPKTRMRSLDSYFIYERTLVTGIAFLDVRIPEIREMFKQKFEEKLQKETVIDKKTIDEMLDEYSVILEKINNATEEMLRPSTSKCKNWV